MATEMNARVITINQLGRLVSEAFDSIDEGLPPVPICVFGKAGIGKTDSIHAKAIELKIGYKELRLAHMTETDLIGVPTTRAIKGSLDESGMEKQVTSYATCELLPVASRDGERGILVLDEISSAQPSVIATALQLTDSSRGVGNYKLPKEWLVVALGNGMNDGGVYVGMPDNFINRGYGARIEVTYSEWKMWAVKHGIEPSIIAFLNFQPEALHTLDTDAEGPQVFASPRSWVALSRKIQQRERKGAALTVDDIYFYSGIAVGADVGDKFTAFYKYKSKVPNIEDILSGKLTDAPEMEAQTRGIVVQSIVSNMNRIINDSEANGDSSLPDEQFLQVSRLFNFVASMGKRHMEDGVAAIEDINSLVPGLIDIASDPRSDKLIPDYFVLARQVYEMSNGRK